MTPTLYSVFQVFVMIIAVILAVMPPSPAGPRPLTEAWASPVSPTLPILATKEVRPARRGRPPHKSILKRRLIEPSAAESATTRGKVRWVGRGGPASGGDEMSEYFMKSRK